MFDGDVDAVWVENMNSVMDDNKLLTLPNSERIRVQNHCKLLFEVADLQYASPATISRCGMVYVDSRNLGYSPFVSSWLASVTNQEEQDLLRGLFEKYATPCIAWVIEGVEGDELVKRPQQSIPTTNLNMIRQLTTLLDALANGNYSDTQVIFLHPFHEVPCMLVVSPTLVVPALQSLHTSERGISGIIQMHTFESEKGCCE